MEKLQLKPLKRWFFTNATPQWMNMQYFIN